MLEKSSLMWFRAAVCNAREHFRKVNKSRVDIRIFIFQNLV